MHGNILPGPHGAAASQAAAEKDMHPLPRHRRKELFSFFQGKDSSEASEMFKPCRQLSKIRDKSFKGQKGWKRDNRGWGEEKASQLRAAVGWEAAHRLPSSSLTFHIEDTMGHSEHSGHVGRSGATAEEKKTVARRRHLGPVPGLQLHCGVHPNPTQTPHYCCPHWSPAASRHPRGQDMLRHAPGSHGTVRCPTCQGSLQGLLTSSRLTPAYLHIFQFVWDSAPVPRVPKDPPGHPQT